MSAPTVEEVLEQRRHRDDRRRDRWAAIAAVGLHAMAVVTALVLPLLTAETPERPRILPVRLVPLQRMGRPDAPPEREVRTRPQREEPKPEPARPEPPEPQPEPPKPQAAPPPEPTPEPRRPEPEPREPERPAEPTPADPGRLGSPQGDPMGTSAFGARITGVDPGFTYDSYLQRMLSRIEGEWRRPGVEGVVEAVIHFEVDKDGTVRDLRVLESSGHRPFDLAAVRAVQNASPLPPLPRSYRKDSLGVNLIVR